MNQKFIVSVIGTGRSGTHLLGNLISTSVEVTASIEDKKLFPLITQAAVYNTREEIKKISRLLNKRLRRCKTKIYLEKSHPLIWLADDSQIIHRNMKFIGIYRNPYATVASMIKHKGVRRWCENYENFPLPNIFLGINQGNIEEYKKLTLAERCILRWISHRRELDRLQYKFSEEKYCLLRYEDILLRYNVTIDKLENFLEIDDIDRKYVLQIESLDKWKDELSEVQIEKINNMLVDYKMHAYVQD